MPAQTASIRTDGNGELELVAAGYAGEAGAVLIARANRALLEGRFRRDLVERMMLRARVFPPDGGVLQRTETEGEDPQEDPAFGRAPFADLFCGLFRSAGALEIFPALEGGILAAVYLAAREKKCGVRIMEKRIPIRQDTVELCELWRLNPYRLYSDCALLTAQSGERLAERLRDAGIPAARIGFFTGGLDKVIADKEETEYLNRPEPDELYRVMTPEGARTDTTIRKGRIRQQPDAPLSG